MRVEINRNSETPIYLQIKNSIRNKILGKELVNGARLPSERLLAGHIKVHRNTVIKAYDELIKDGFVIVSNAPKGYFVSSYCHEEKLIHQNNNKFLPLEKMIQYEFISTEDVFHEIYCDSIKEGIISFAGVMADSGLIPLNEINTIINDLVQANRFDIYDYCDPEGLESLREGIASILLDRQIKVSANNILIVSETYQAIEYISKLYLNPGDTIIMEEPVAPDIVNTFRNNRIKVVTVGMDADGMMMDHLESLIKIHSPKFIYTIPNHHSPSSIVMSLDRRCELLRIATNYNIPIMEEDCQSELNFSDYEIPTLYSMDSKNVVYINSFIFSFFPGARIGYVIAPKLAVDHMCKMISKDQIFVNSLSQYILSEFIKRGYYKNHIKKLKCFYQDRRDWICKALREIESIPIEFSIPRGGLCVWCKLPDNVNQRKLKELAEKEKVLIMPGFLFFPFGNQGDNFIRLSYSNVSKEQIKTGITILEKCILMSVE